MSLRTTGDSRRARLALGLIAGMLAGVVALGGACARPDNTESARLAQGLVADAAPLPSPPSLAHPGVPIPGNGVVLILTQGSGTPVVEVMLSGANAPAVAGTLTMFGGYWVWRALSTLPAGEYTVTMSNDPAFAPLASASEPLTVVSPVMSARPNLSSAPSARFVPQPTAWACCQSWTGSELIDGLCFGAMQSGAIILDLGLDSTDSMVTLSQFLFRPRFVGEGLMDGISQHWGPSRALQFTEQAEEYCYEIQAIDVGTGMTYEYLDLTPRCAAHGDLPSLSEQPVEASDDSLHPRVCHVPPPSYEMQWCALSDRACAAEPMATGCALVGYVCDGEPLPVGMPTAGGGSTGGVGGQAGNAGASGWEGIPPTGGASPQGGSGAVAGTAGPMVGAGAMVGSNAGMTAGEAGASAQGKSLQTSGCSVSRVTGAAGASTSTSTLLAALAWLLAARRRRARA